MAIFEDPLTGDFPSRVTLDEDEKLAEPHVSRYFVEPEYQWGGEPVQCDELILLVGDSAAVLASTLYADAQPLGSCTVPSCQPMPHTTEAAAQQGDGDAGPHTLAGTGPVAKVIRVFLWSLPATRTTTLASVPAPLPEEQADTLARSLLRTLCRAGCSVHVASTCPLRDLRGHAGDATGSPLVFALSTAADQGVGVPAAYSRAWPPLPPGMLLQGLSAAVLTRGALQGLHVCCLVGVQPGPAPETHLCTELARAIGSRTGRSITPGVRTAIGGACDGIYRSSAAASMFS
ncbi:hypothetical protein ACKKBF_B05655 [Auxenochlorella protothecoides x Auxenochlorella symbiontica]